MTTHQLIEQVLNAAIEKLRQTSFMPFWKASIDLTPHDEIADLFRDTGKTETLARGELEEAAAQEGFDSFDLIVTDRRRDCYGNAQGVSIHARLKDNSEWDAALRHAWRDADSPNDWFLSDNALRMFSWLQSKKNTGEFSPENRIGAQAGLRGSGSYSKVETYLKEISLKSPYQVTFEQKGRWHGDYKARIEPKTDERKTEKFSNPVFPGSLLASDRDSVLTYAQMILDGILKTDIDETKDFLLFNIHSRASFLLALPDLATKDEFSPYEFKQFLSKVRLTHGLKVAATFSDSASEGWQLGAVLEEGWTWDRARRVILEQRQRENPEKTYGLSSRAAKIFEWMLDLHDDEFELGMTPCVEAKAEEQMGIKGLAYNQNSEALLRLLVEEINEKTPYLLRLIPWKDCARDYHRILLRRDPEGDEDLVRKIQIRGLDKGVHLTSLQVERMLRELWKSGNSE